MDESKTRCARWTRWLGIVGMSLWLAACTPLPVAQESGAALSTCTVPVGGGEGDTTTQPCPEPADSLQPADPFERPAPSRPRPPRKPSPALPPVAEPAVPPSSPYELSPPRESDQQGLASWYGPRFHGRRTASGERFDSQDLTAAHRTLAFGTRVCVRSSITGKAVVVRINDRGPFIKGRMIDLSKAAAKALGFKSRGHDAVVLREVLPARANGELVASGRDS